MGRDYKARHLWREEALAADALKVRRQNGYRDNELAFDIWECFARLPFTRSVPIKYFDPGAYEDPAFVKFDPLELHIDREKSRAADEHEGEGRVVVAHEISHLRLHRDGLNSFSPYGANEQSWYIQERSIEWQARTWTGYFLVPDSIVQMFRNADELAEMCRVNLETAEFRLEQFQEHQRRLALSSLCQTCGSFKAAEKGRLICPDCQM
jgi:hypothetical protein